MKILVCHPGHAFSTADVFNGLCYGLAEAGAEVVPFRWDKALAALGAMTGTAVASGDVPATTGRKIREFATWLAAADVLATALEQEVDAILVVNGLLFPAQRAHLAKKLGKPVACYGTEAPYFMEYETQICGAYTHWFTQERRCVAHFQQHMGNAHYLPMAYNPAAHYPAAPDPERACDVVFVGGGYPERRKLLDGVDWARIDHVRVGTLWDIDWTQPRDPNEPGRYGQGSVDNTETTAWHRSARISLNMHRRMTRVEVDEGIPAGAAESLGPRAYEIPAVGGFMLCDDERPEIAEVYGDAAATFRAWDAADLERQIRYYLDHPDARDAKAKAQYEAVQPHSYTARARAVLEVLS